MILRLFSMLVLIWRTSQTASEELSTYKTSLQIVEVFSEESTELTEYLEVTLGEVLDPAQVLALANSVLLQCKTSFFPESQAPVIIILNERHTDFPQVPCLSQTLHSLVIVIPVTADSLYSTVFSDILQVLYTELTSCDPALFMTDWPTCLSILFKHERTLLECEEGYFPYRGQCQLKCDWGYYPNAGSCTSCSTLIPHCSSCSIDGLKCYDCDSFFQLATNACVHSDKYCEEYNELKECIQCKASFTLTEGLCTKCMVSDGCVEYSTDCECTRCGIGKFLENGQCFDCNRSLEQCRECSVDASTCYSCDSNFYLTSHWICEKCENRYEGCELCTEFGEMCLACMEGFHLNEFGCVEGVAVDNCEMYSEGSCSECETGYMLQDGACIACETSLSHCKACEAGLCIHCLDYFLLVEGQCEQCHEISGCFSYRPDCSCEYCEKGLYLSKNTCSSDCPRAYKLSEILAYFNPDYTSITVEFDEEPTEIVNNCEFLIVEADLHLLGETPVCTWTNTHTLLIELGEKHSLRDSFITLKPLSRKTGHCSATVPDLKIFCQHFYMYPAPQFTLDFADFYSLPCESDDLTATIIPQSGMCMNPLIYSWTVHGPSTYLSVGNQAFVSLPRSSLKPGKYQFIVTAKNVFGVSTEEQFEIAVVEDKAISIRIDTGSKVTMTASEARTFTAYVNSLCLAPKLYWVFLGTLNGEIDENDPVRTQVNGHKLKIDKGQLQPGLVYVFRAATEEGEAGGVNTLVITVEASPLKASINRSDGTISSTQDLELSTTPYCDPDSPHDTNCEFRWACTYQHSGSACMKFSEYLVNSPRIIIPSEKLSLGVTYQFTLHVQKGNREARDALKVTVVESEHDVTVLRPKEIVNFQQDIILWPEISTGPVKWQQVSGERVLLSSSLESPFLVVTKNSLKPGRSYQFEARCENATALIHIETNRAPVCFRGLEILQQGELYSFTLGECMDTHSPLVYSFGVEWKGVYMPLTPGSHSQKITVRVPSGFSKWIGIVCDSIGTCAYYKKEIYTQHTELGPIDFDGVNELLPYYTFLTAMSGQLVDSEWIELFERLVNFEGDTDPFTCSSLLMAISALLESPVEPEHLQSVLNLIKVTVEHSAFKLSDNDLAIVMDSLNTLYQLGDSALQYEIHEVFQVITLKQLEGIPPTGYPLILSRAQTSSSTSRWIANDLSSSVHSIANTNVTLPASLPFPPESVVTVKLTEYSNPSNIAVDLTFYSSGYYQNHSLSLASDKEFPLTNLDTPIEITIPCEISKKSEAQCMYFNPELQKWDPRGCTLTRVENNKCTISTSHTSMFSIQPLSLAADCSLSFMPLYLVAMYFLALPLLVLGLKLAVREPELDDQILRVYAVDNDVSKPIQLDDDFTRSAREIVVFGIEEHLGTASEDIIGPELKQLYELNPGQPVSCVIVGDEESYGFWRHHLYFGQGLPYCYSDQLRYLLLLLNWISISCICGVFTELGDTDTWLSIASVGLIAVAITSLLVLALEVVIGQVSRTKSSVLGTVLLALCMIGVASIYYLTHSHCEDFALTWTYISAVTIAADMFFVQSGIAVLKKLTLNN